MSRSSEARTSDKSIEETLNERIIDSIQDVKGKNIVKLDLRKVEESPTSYFIICEGDSTTQVKAIADRIERKVKEEMNTSPLRSEGQQSAKWICIDYFDTIVHVFYPETRQFYDLEELWSDASFTEYHSF